MPLSLHMLTTPQHPLLPQAIDSSEISRSFQLPICSSDNSRLTTQQQQAGNHNPREANLKKARHKLGSVPARNGHHHPRFEKMEPPALGRPDVAALVVAWPPGWSVWTSGSSVTPGFKLSHFLLPPSCWSTDRARPGVKQQRAPRERRLDPTLPIITPPARSAVTGGYPLRLQLCVCACWCMARRCNRDRIGPSQGTRGAFCEICPGQALADATSFSAAAQRSRMCLA
ncbi:hypothetical protein VTI74DRAFT_3951 [Chaetomium olivicolor]